MLSHKKLKAVLLTLFLCVAFVTCKENQADNDDKDSAGVGRKSGSENQSPTRKNPHEEINESQKTWFRDAMKWWAGLSAWKSKTEQALKTELKVLQEAEATKDSSTCSNEQENEKPACGREYKLRVNGSSYEITSPNFYSPLMYPDNLKCNYEIYGEVGCKPSVMCSVFDIRKTHSSCTEEYLEISDGLGDSVRFCGKKVPRPHERWLSSKGERDLFLTFVTSQSRRGADLENLSTGEDNPTQTSHKPDKDGFLCKIQCSHVTDSKHYSEEIKIRTLAKPEKEEQVEERCRCGLGGNNEERIVGGTTVVRNSYPWQVAIVEKGTRKPFCGGALINDRFVLTASHCFPPDYDTSLEKNIEVLLNAHLLDASRMDNFNENAKQGERGWLKAAGWDKGTVTDADEETLRHRVKEIMLHPLYRNGKFDYDVSLLRLAGRVKLTGSDGPAPICLPDQGTYENYEGQNATVIGWGLGDEKGGTTTRLLQELSVPLLPLERCREWMPKNNITTRMMCAGFEDGKQDACRADSGGPLMRKVRGKYWEQIGVVSWGVGCARKKKPGFYSKVVELNQWIQHMTSEFEVKWCPRPG